MTENLQDQLRVEGINSMGYGIMPKAIMKDDRLTIEAKAIYAYFVSFAGAGNTAFPKLKTILADLNIGEKRFYKHRKLLIDCGYISVQAHRNEKAVIYKNIYTLIANPEVNKEVSVKTTEEVSVKTTEGDIRQNDRDKLLLTSFKINNIKDDDELIYNTRMKQALKDHRLKDQYANQIAKVIDKDHTPYEEAIKQQLEWMCQKLNQGDSISNFTTYFVNGYKERCKTIDTLKQEEEPLPTIPMFNWLETA